MVRQQSCPTDEGIGSLPKIEELRRVKGVTRRDRIQNKEIRKDLQTEPVLEFVKKRQLG